VNRDRSASGVSWTKIERENGDTSSYPVSRNVSDHNSGDVFLDNLNRDDALQLFDEDIDFSLDAGVPDPLPFETKLKNMLETHEAFLRPEQYAIANKVMVVVRQFAMLESSGTRLDTEQEREQEQEQEKEIEQRREQVVEVERFVDREYSRQQEVQRPWPFTILAQRLEQLKDEHPFYPLKEFKLRHQEPLDFPDILRLSSNFFNPNWTGLRRLKNIVMVNILSIDTTSLMTFSYTSRCWSMHHQLILKSYD
jgi:hypothetical protein